MGQQEVKGDIMHMRALTVIKTLVVGKQQKTQDMGQWRDLCRFREASPTPANDGVARPPVLSRMAQGILDTLGPSRVSTRDGGRGVAGNGPDARAL